jgi:hypothetical protein
MLELDAGAARAFCAERHLDLAGFGVVMFDLKKVAAVSRTSFVGPGDALEQMALQPRQMMLRMTRGRYPSISLSVSVRKPRWTLMTSMIFSKSSPVAG